MPLLGSESKGIDSLRATNRFPWTLPPTGAIHRRGRSAIDRVFLYPVESPRYQKEGVQIALRHRHAHALAVDVALEREPRWRRSLVREHRLPRAVACFSEREGALHGVDGAAESLERLIHLLKCRAGRRLKDRVPIAQRVGRERRSELAVDRHRVHVPDTVERRLRRAGAVRLVALPSTLDLQA